MFCFRIKIRSTCKNVNQAIINNESCWQDLCWTADITLAYKNKLKNTWIPATLLQFPALKAAIYYCYHTRIEKVFLVGFSKYVHNTSNKMRISHYTSNLYKHKNMLCYHYVVACDIKSAKHQVTQKGHRCKKNIHDIQLICKSGMSYSDVQHNKHLKKLLYIVSQETNQYKLKYNV